MRFPHKAERVSLPHRKVVALGKLDMMNYNNNAGIPVGFRFHPTDEELVGCYLYSRIARPPPPLDPLEEDLRIIRELDLYRHEPWHLSEVCKIPGDHSANQNNWYFFSHKDKKYPTGNRANRATKAGFWKATGRDKCIQTRGAVGMRKTLVFYRGRAPHGQKTDWIMHEFRLDVDGNQLPLPNFSSRPSSGSDLEDAGAWVVCRVFRKTKALKCKDDNSNDTPTTSVEEDHQMALLPEITDSTEKFSSDEGEHVDYPPAEHMQQQQQHFHPDYSHVQQPCKQELLSVNDYAVEHHCAVLTFEGAPAMSPSSMFRTSSGATGTNPNYNTFLDPPPPVLFEHQMLGAMPFCSSSSSAPASSSAHAAAAAALFSPSPNNPYQLAMPADENLPPADTRGLSSFRNSPAALDGLLGDFRTENQVAPLLDQSRMDALPGPLERQQQQQQLQHAQEILRFTASHDVIPFGMSWGPRSSTAGSQFGDFCLGSDLNTTFLSSGDHQQR